jgi:hypothetical protein
MLTGIVARLFGCLCVFALGGMASHAGAANPSPEQLRLCQDIIRMNGYLFRAAEVCNEKWGDRLSLLDNIIRLRQCLDLEVIDEKHYNVLIDGGSASFDHQMGGYHAYEAGCRVADLILNTFDKNVEADPQRLRAVQEEKVRVTPDQ